MNHKIEFKYLNITNYPYVEKYFENMASRGWLIKKIILGSIFIFKKIEPEELDFSISPYEVETAFTRKSKEELEEFQTVCESVGWNYSTKSYDLHVYFKSKDSDAMDIHTDDEEEFKSLDNIGKRQLMTYFFLIPLLLLFTWFNFGRVFNNIHSMKDGLTLIMLPLIPIGLGLSIVEWTQIKNFLDKNRENIELGKEIEYSNSKFYFQRFSFIITFVFLLIFIMYVLYMSIVLKNRIVLMVLLPIFIGLLIGQLYRIFIKPSKYFKRHRGITFLAVIIVVSVFSMDTVIDIGNIDQIGARDHIDRDEYKILRHSDFENVDSQEESMIEKASLFVPRSYDYTSRRQGEEGTEYLLTEYANALNENLANRLVELYIRQAENAIIGRAHYSETTLSTDELIEKGIRKVDDNLYVVDEAYFLRDDKSEIVLRRGNEVFYLSGMDFSDLEVIRISREKLGL